MTNHIRGGRKDKKQRSFTIKDLVFGVLLALMLCAVALPCFNYPPMSDDWEFFYFIHNLDDVEGSFDLPHGLKWLHILNRDPNERMRFQPLAHMFYYLLYLIFGSRFFLFKIFNLALYLFSILVLYRFSALFIKRRIISALMLGAYAFLYNSFDIALWSAHMYVIAGFIMLLTGFIIFSDQLENQRVPSVWTTAPLFLGGMLCYESYFLWPLGLFFILSIKKITGRYQREISIKKATRKIIISVYAAYIIIYFLTRLLGTYDSTTYGIADFFRLGNFLAAGFSVLFNLLYNNILMHLFPVLSFPLTVSENIYMDGPIIEFLNREHTEIIYLGGLVTAVMLLTIFRHLYTRGRIKEIKTLGFLLFLALSEAFIVFFCRIAGNGMVYCLTEFRYQYIPNAFVFLSAAYLCDRFVDLDGKKMKILSAALLLLVVQNITFTRRYINIYNTQLKDLRHILSQISKGIRKGDISPEKRLYIDEDLPEYLPNLSWNTWMSELFIKKGNYHWLFTKKEQEALTFTPKDCFWRIDKDDFIIKRCTDVDGRKGKKIVSEKGKYHNSENKDNMYVELGFFYNENREDPVNAEIMFKKALDLNPENSRALIELGSLYLQQGKNEKAVSVWDRAIEADPGNTDLYNRIISIFISEEDFASVYRYLKRAPAGDPLISESYSYLGHKLNDLGRYVEAEGHFKTAMELNRSNQGAYDGLAYVYQKQGRYDEAEKLYRGLIDINPTSDIGYTSLGHLYNEQNRYKEAEKMFNRGLSIYRLNPHAHLGLAVAHIKMGNYRKAEKHLLKAIAIDDTLADGYVELGLLYNRLERYSEAEEMLYRGIELNPGLSHAYPGLAETYNKDGRFDEASRLLLLGLEKDAGLRQHILEAGTFYLNMGRYKNAEQMFHAVLKIYPGQTDAMEGLRTVKMMRDSNDKKEPRYSDSGETGHTEDALELGHIYNEQGRFREAEKVFLRVISESPEDKNAYIGLATSYRGQGDKKRTEKMYRKAIALDPEYTEAYADMAHFYNDTDRYKEAEEKFRRALELTGGRPDIYEGLCISLIKRRQHDKAESIFDKLSILEPEKVNMYINTEMAIFYLEKERYDKAEGLLRKALKTAPDYAPALTTMGLIYRKQGSPERALEMFKKALESSPDDDTARDNMIELETLLDKR